MKLKGTVEEIIEQLQELNKEQEYDFVYSKKETKEIRTLRMNNFWYWLFSDIEKQTPFSLFTIKHYILWRVFGKQECYWELVNNKTETSKLTKKEWWDLISWIQTFCFENWIIMKYISKEEQSLFNSN